MPLSAEEEEVQAFLRSEHESYYRGDFDTFISHWHHGPEVRRILSGPRVGTRIHSGWAELKPRFEEGFRQFPQNFDARESLRWDNIQVQVSGDMAWVTYDQVIVGHVPRIHAAPLSHETKIVQKFDGEWKLLCVIVVVPGVGHEDVPRIELNVDGTVVAINALARERLASHSGLTVSGHRVRALNRAFEKDLQQAINLCRERLATNLPRGFLGEEANMVPLGEDEQGHPLFCWVFTEQERVLISFDDAYLLRGRLETAGLSFGLSPAQLKLAERLASGLDLTQAASELDVTVNTVRTQVRRMFEKTQTHNQAAMVSRLLNVQAPD
ncbi:MAG: LuxR C-terminal-related transcriptional regulator [Alphaproteobacteria bacterium]|nr:LuxR C-terminal-related transcriptional regulator [Alphaproteobacteria bacterium]